MSVHLFYFIMLFLGFCSCRSGRTATESDELHIRDSMSMAVMRHQTDIEQMESLMRLDENLNLDFTIYLPPDSNGHQPVHAKGTLRRASSTMKSGISLHNKEDTLSAAGQQKMTQHSSSEKVSHEESEKMGFSYMKFYIVVPLCLLSIFILIKIKSWLH